MSEKDEDLFPGKTDDEVAALARGFVLDEHCDTIDNPELPEPIGYET